MDRDRLRGGIEETLSRYDDGEGRSRLVLALSLIGAVLVGAGLVVAVMLFAALEE